MLHDEHKKIFLIGGVVAGSLIILATRILLGEGFTRREPTETESRIKQSLRELQTEASESYAEYQSAKQEYGVDLEALKAKVESEAQGATSNETIKELGEKLKTASTEDQTQ